MNVFIWAGLSKGDLMLPLTMNYFLQTLMMISQEFLQHQRLCEVSEDSEDKEPREDKQESKD